MPNNRRVGLTARQVEAAIAAAFNAGVATLNVRNIADALAAGGVEAIRPRIQGAAAVAVAQLRRTLPRIVRDAMREAAESELPIVRRQTISLREQGLSLRAIAAATGTSEPTVRRDVSAGASFDTPQKIEPHARAIAAATGTTDGTVRNDLSGVQNWTPQTTEPHARAIAAATGAGFGSTQRDAASVDPCGSTQKLESPATTTGLDGKSYAARRTRTTVEAEPASDGNLRSAQDETDETFPDLQDPDDSGDLPIVSDLDLREIGFDAAGETIVEEQVEQLASELGESMTAGLLLLLTLGLAAGVAVTALAQRIRLGLGLRPDQARAVANLARELATANPGRLVTRFRPLPGVRTRPGFAVRIPPGGATAAWIEQQLLRYIPMLLRARARLIGKTLSATAWERGRALLWTLALRSGLLPPGTARRWQTAGDARVCPRCRRMEGQISVLGEPFVSPDVGSLPGPPLHAQCRCTAVLVRHRSLSSNQSTNSKEKRMSKITQVFRRMGGVAGEGADLAKWRAANTTPALHEAKVAPRKLATPTPEQQERRRIIAKFTAMDVDEKAQMYDRVREQVIADHAPPDPYAAALAARRNKYPDDEPRTYQELEQ